MENDVSVYMSASKSSTTYTSTDPRLQTSVVMSKNPFGLSGSELRAISSLLCGESTPTSIKFIDAVSRRDVAVIAVPQD